MRGSMPASGVTLRPDKSGRGRLGSPTDGRLIDGRDKPPPSLGVDSVGLGSTAFFTP